MPPKPTPSKPRAKTPVYTGPQVRKLQEQKNKPKTKQSMGYKGATRV